MRIAVSEETRILVKQMAESGNSVAEIILKFGLSRSMIFKIIKNKKYVYDRIDLTGLTQPQKDCLKNIAKNKDVDVNKLIRSYIKEGLNNEPPANKIYLD